VNSNPFRTAPVDATDPPPADPLAHLREKLLAVKAAAPPPLTKEEQAEADLLQEIADEQERQRADDTARRTLRLRRGKVEAERAYPKHVIGTLDLDRAGMYVLRSATVDESAEYSRKLSEVQGSGGSTTQIEYNFVNAHVLLAEPKKDSEEYREALTFTHGFALTSLMNKISELSALSVEIKRSKSG
jgi:hypothetical protein